MSYKYEAFDDVLLENQFSDIDSRKDVNPSVRLFGSTLNVPIVSSNMDSVTGSAMAAAMFRAGGRGCLHRFQSISDNVNMFNSCAGYEPWVSIGLGTAELERADALYSAGAKVFVIDVANGASEAVVSQTNRLRQMVKDNAAIVVGNFATHKTTEDFAQRLGYFPDGWKVGIGSGSACTTRVVTGFGMPLFASLMELRHSGVPIIADGGIRNGGDFAKAIAAGASAVMMGRIFAGTKESPGELFTRNVIVSEEKYGYGEFAYTTKLTQEQKYKKYRGSASLESYEAQGKVAAWRAPEGEAFEVPYQGTVAEVMQRFEGNLRSAMTQGNGRTLKEFKEKAKFIRITSNATIESGAHGKASSSY